jgi:hypothetical protein
MGVEIIPKLFLIAIYLLLQILTKLSSWKLAVTSH